MLVEVTQENINQGVAGNPESCPVALAMEKNGFEDVEVGDTLMCYSQQPSSLQFYTPVCIKVDSPISQWIYDFDGGEEVFPIQINIDEDGQYVTLVE